MNVVAQPEESITARVERLESIVQDLLVWSANHDMLVAYAIAGKEPDGTDIERRSIAIRDEKSRKAFVDACHAILEHADKLRRDL